MGGALRLGLRQRNRPAALSGVKGINDPQRAKRRKKTPEPLPQMRRSTDAATLARGLHQTPLSGQRGGLVAAIATSTHETIALESFSRESPPQLKFSPPTPGSDRDSTHSADADTELSPHEIAAAEAPAAIHEDDNQDWNRSSE